MIFGCICCCFSKTAKILTFTCSRQLLPGFYRNVLKKQWSDVLRNSRICCVTATQIGKIIAFVVILHSVKTWKENAPRQCTLYVWETLDNQACLVSFAQQKEKWKNCQLRKCTYLLYYCNTDKKIVAFLSLSIQNSHRKRERQDV